MLVLKILAIWCALSVVVGLVVGAAIADAQDDQRYKGCD